MKGETVQIIKDYKLKDYEFHCNKCNTVHKASAYCIAQKTMGYEIIFTCECGNKIEVEY